jgi:hypothetical protein
VTPIERYALLFDFIVVVIVLLIARRLRRGWKPLPMQNWKPSDDDARSGRRITLMMFPKGKPRR